MARLAPKILRYTLGIFVLFWAVAGQVSIVVFVYSIVEQQFAAVPQLGRDTLGMVLIATTLFTIGVGYYRFGSLISVLAGVTAWIEGGEKDDTVVEGRVLGNNFAWRLRYREGDRITVECRDCPRCGQELVERHLPSHVVFESNSAFDPATASRTAAEDVWRDVTGKEKAEDRGETLALTCPDCNVSEPGNKEVMEGKDVAVSRFQSHIDEMKRSNPKDSPFQSYRTTADSDRPTPADIWDAYVGTVDAEDVLPVRAITPKRSAKEDDETVKV